MVYFSGLAELPSCVWACSHENESKIPDLVRSGSGFGPVVCQSRPSIARVRRRSKRMRCKLISHIAG
jgi:hypothetical protein